MAEQSKIRVAVNGYGVIGKWRMRSPRGTIWNWPASPTSRRTGG